MSRRIASLVLAASLFTAQTGWAECKWAEGVKKAPDGTHYDYTKECHKRVGDTVEELDKRRQQVELQQLTIKDLQVIALEYHKEADVFKNGMKKLEDRNNALEKLESKNKVLYFILGVVVTGAAVYGAGQLK